MTDNNSTTRRAFLGAGALLTVGALVLPASTAAALPVLPGIDPLTQARAILDAPNAVWFGPDKVRCQCARCRVIRRRVFDCAVCGFSGAPVVEPCECKRVRESNRRYARTHLAAWDAGTPMEGDTELWIEGIRSELQYNAARPDLCRALLTKEQRMAAIYNCGHGGTSCPTCGASEGDEHSPMGGGDSCPLTDTIRALRVALSL